MATQDRDRAGTVHASRAELVVVCGLPGAGKSTVADWVADRLDAVHLRTDEIRKELFPDPAYTDEETEAVYATLVERGRTALAAGQRAVLDGTFKTRRHRLEPARVAAELGVDWRLLKVEADEDVVTSRIRSRTDDVSDADVAVHELFRSAFEPIRLDHEVLDNSRSFEETARQLERRFAEPQVA